MIKLEYDDIKNVCDLYNEKLGVLQRIKIVRKQTGAKDNYFLNCIL